jgi:uncharacterized protein YndB with AHSA1/START domain
MSNETIIEIDEKVPLVRITREFDAPLEKVFRAHTDARLLEQWMGPRSLETTYETFDCRTGGAYRFVSRRNGEEYAFHGSYHEIRPNESIVQTFTWEGMPDHVALEKVFFEDLGDGRTRISSTSLVDSFADRDAFIANGMEDGVREGFERLDELLAS